MVTVSEREANRLELRSGPTYVGPDLGSSLFAISQKYWYISIPNEILPKIDILQIDEDDLFKTAQHESKS